MCTSVRDNISLSWRSMNTFRLSLPSMTQVRYISRFAIPQVTVEFPYGYSDMPTDQKWKPERIIVCFHNKQRINLGLDYTLLNERCSYGEEHHFHHQEFPLRFSNIVDGIWKPSIMNVWLYSNPIKIKVKLDYTVIGHKYYIEHEMFLPWDYEVEKKKTKWITLNIK